MADIRSLLRSERISRRIDHPNASYSATGTLECSVCHIPLKSDVDVWNKHLKSTQHAMRAERFRLNQKTASSKPDLPAASRETSNGTKKRIVSVDDDDSRKRTRPVINSARRVSIDSKDRPKSSFLHPTSSKSPTSTTHLVSPANASPQPSPTQPPQQAIDEAEWAAFERDVATSSPPPPATGSTSAFTAQATISAAPISAAELAKQDREEERATDREPSEAELEAEKEDAARALEEEFDEMEGLEERVRRLREKREELRLRTERERKADKGNSMNGVESISDQRPEDDVGDEDSEDEDFDDDWGFGRRA